MRRHYLIGLLLAAVTTIVFRQVLGHGFLNYDDGVYVTENPHIGLGLIPAAMRWAFTATYAANWHPLTWISHMADVSLFGLKPAGHHLTSLLLHILNTLLLFLVLLRLTDGPQSGIPNPKSGIRAPLSPSSLWRCAFIAALFAIHPLHVESVAWIAERKDVLSTFLFLLTILAYVRYVHKPGTARYLLVVGLFVLGLMAKPMLVTLPFVLLLLDYWPLNRFSVHWEGEDPAEPGPRGVTTARQEPRPPDSRQPSTISHQPFRGTNTQHPAPNTNPSLCRGSISGGSKSKSRNLVLEKLPLLFLSAGACVVTFVAQEGARTVGTLEGLPLGMRVSNALISYVGYMWKTIWPVGLAVFYPHPGDGIQTWKTISAAVILVGISAAVVRAASRKPYLLTGWLWYVGTLVPVIGLVQVGEQAMADRYTYVPLIGLFLMIAWGVPDLAARGRLGEWESGGRMDAETRRRGDAANAKFRTSDTRNPKPVTEERSPNTQHPTPTPVPSPTALLAIAVLVILCAVSWRQVGYWKNDGTLFRHALDVTADSEVAHNNLGLALMNQGDSREAAEHFREALRIDPDCRDAKGNLINVMLSSGDPRDAELALRQMIESNPDDAKAHNNLGNALLAQNRREEAIAVYKQAIHLNPRDAKTHHNLGWALAASHRTSEAISEYRIALDMDSGLARTHHALARALEHERDYTQAWKEVHKARELGLIPDPTLIRMLSARMPDPGD